MAIEYETQEIIALAKEVRQQKLSKQQFLQNLSTAASEDEKQRILRWKTKQQNLDYYNSYILELLDRIDRANQRILAEFEEPETPAPEQPQQQPSPQPKKQKKEKFYISKRTRKRYLREIGANEEILNRILHPKKKKSSKKYEDVEYTVYEPSIFGKISNLFFDGITRSLTRSYPGLFDSLYRAIRSSDMKILSRTYISMMLFRSFLGFFTFLVAGIFVNFFFQTPVTFALISSSVVALIISILIFTVSFVYPSTIVSSRKRKIHNDLPFMIIHMAAVAGSGAKPMSIFKLVVSSGEYPGIESEMKKVLNYTNLFGYNISTALKTVATTTPSPRLRDLLTGMVATIESGGSLKSYLNGMAKDAMHTYKLQREKYVQTLSTYSDIYTGILIAAPLLFIVTLAIINLIGGNIGGISIKALSIGGTYVVLPLLNIAFLLFLNLMQPEL